MATYQLIASSTLSSSASQISFTSIPQTYTDLVIRASLRGVATATTYIEMGFNGTVANINSINLNALTGSGQNSYNYSTDLLDIAGETPFNWVASTFSNVEYIITNYTQGVHKVVSMDSIAGYSSTSAYMSFTSGKFASNNAITSVQLIASGGGDTFATYSSAFLYGIKNT